MVRMLIFIHFVVAILVARFGGFPSCNTYELFTLHIQSRLTGSEAVIMFKSV